MLRTATAILNLLIAVALHLAGSSPAAAQTIPWFEVGPIFSSTPFRIGFPSDARGFGFGGRFVVNPHRNLAGEFQVSHSPSLDDTDGSGTTAIGHLKLVVRREERMKFNIFALAGPGWMHEHMVCCGGHPSEDIRSSLVWDLGGGIEYVPVRRVSVRSDFTDLIQTRTFLMAPAKHYQSFNFTVGVLYRWN